MARSMQQISKDLDEVHAKFNTFMKMRSEFTPTGRREYIRKLRIRLLDLAIELKDSRSQRSNNGDIYSRMAQLKAQFDGRDINNMNAIGS